jgi:hypothetical protein
LIYAIKSPQLNDPGQGKGITPPNSKVYDQLEEITGLDHQTLKDYKKSMEKKNSLIQFHLFI